MMGGAMHHRLPASWQEKWAVWSSWEDDLDVSGGRQRAAWWAWLLLAAGVLAVMVSVDHVDALRLKQEDTAEQVKRLSRADRQMRLQRALAAAPQEAPASASGPHAAVKEAASPAPALQGATVPAARRMVGLLAYPWSTQLDLLDAQATQAQVVMTQVSASLDGALSPGAGSGRLGMPAVRWQLKAYAKDDASALAFAHRLPQGELTNREVATQSFTTRAGTYALQVALEMQP